MALSPGNRLGPYEILAPLGAGGMGEVYRARDPRLGRDVAIKVLPEHLSHDPQALLRFEREAKAVAALSHPNILAVFDVGSEQGVHYLVTELLGGETLRARLNGTPIPWRKAVEIGAAIAEGLSAAHSKGIIHRDLKPENIFLTSDGRVKILDFGLARLQPALSPHGATSAPTETASGTILGTAGYMSPEQVRGLPADAPSDIFSLGCVLYEMIAGRRAFAGDSAIQSMAAILQSDPPPLADCGRLHPPELDRIVARCLEKNPSERLQSAQDLSFTLKGLLNVPVNPPTPKPPPVPPRKRLALAAAAALLLTAVIVLSLGPLRDRLSARISPSRIQSLAVLPLGNLSGDPSQEYFADGMTEALISSLAQIRALKVISRTSIMRYRGTTKPLPEIARDLGVDAIVEGSVQRAGGRVRITAQLIHGATDQHLWAKEYEGDLSDVLRLESDVARAIAAEIRIQVTPEERTRLAAARPVNPEAHEAYLLGRYHRWKTNETDLKQAIDHFTRAISLDPNFAAAYAGLAHAWLERGIWGATPLQESEANARAAAAKALQRDETLGEAHTALGHTKYIYDWDWNGAEHEFRRALELDQNDLETHRDYAFMLISVGRSAEAVTEIQRAQLYPGI